MPEHTTKNDSGITAILRSYNDLAITEVLRALSRLGRIDRFIVVVNTHEDTVNTPALVRASRVAQPTKVIELEDYGWAKALNAALATLAEPRRASSVLVVSNEVRLSEQNLNALVLAAALPNASCAYAMFRTVDSATYLLPRNTCCLWAPWVIEERARFDESLDEEGGMEDYALALHIFARRGRLPYLGPRDVELRLRPSIDLRSKVEREIRAVGAIESRYGSGTVEALREHCLSQTKSASG